MKLEICIPTKARFRKLYNCVVSILNSDFGENEVCIRAIFSDKGELDKFSHNIVGKSILLGLFENYRVPMFWNHYLLKSKADVFLCLNDDTLFKKDTVLKLEEAFKNKFPDFDGVVGINQSNGPKKQCLDSAFSAIGIKYADRFPNRQVYCPDYYRFFADAEIGDFAKSINKFYFAEEVKIKHLHPAFSSEAPDVTHNKVREFLSRDRVTYAKRKYKNLLWGRDFETSEKENDAL